MLVHNLVVPELDHLMGNVDCIEFVLYANASCNFTGQCAC